MNRHERIDKVRDFVNTRLREMIDTLDIGCQEEEGYEG